MKDCLPACLLLVPFQMVSRPVTLSELLINESIALILRGCADGGGVSPGLPTACG